MKKYMHLLWLFVGVSMGMVSCIHDETTGFERELSEITITKVWGEGVSEDGKEANVEFMKPSYIAVEVEQTLEDYELSYEWRAGLIEGYDDGLPQVDSMRYISNEPVLTYSFDGIGSYRVRLRVSNEDGSTFYYMTVNVRAGMERGLLVLSMDDTQKGRLSFCPTQWEAGELLDAEAEDFETDVWVRINSEYELIDVRDMITSYTNSIYVLSKTQQCIYELEKNTLMVLGKMDLTVAMDWNIQPISMVGYSVGNKRLAVLSENGELVLSQTEFSGLVQEDFGRSMKCVKIVPASFPQWMSGTYDYAIGIDNENEIITCYGRPLMEAGKGHTGDYFKGWEIVNCGVSGNKKIHVVSRSKNNPNQVQVIAYRDVTDPSTPVFEVDYSYDYTLSSPLTLTLETTLLYNETYRVFFYYDNNRVYRWRYQGGGALPYANDAANAVAVPSGEITCMAQSADKEYLYVGAYDAAAAGLKGNVYIYKAETLELVKSFIGVADKPVKLFYKDIQ